MLRIRIHKIFCSALLILLTCFGWGQIGLTSGQTTIGAVTPGQWRYYYIDVADHQAQLRVLLELTNLQNRGFRLYVRHNALPDAANFDFRPAWSVPSASVTANRFSTPALKTGRYYIGVYGAADYKFKITATTSLLPSAETGMGAQPYAGGSGFRVWAPFADSVHVAGEFNGWSATAAPLFNEGAGHWSMDYRNASPGQRYRYVIRRGSETLWKVDPREEQITNSVGDSVVFDESFAWTDQGFQMPAWNELVVYEMHIGTMNDTPGGPPGTFDTAIQKLDYLQDLGINAIQIMPVAEFPGDFSWGYNPSHPFAVEQAYGGPRALKRFVDAAHARGIAVLLDVVHNHYGPSDLSLWRFDGWSQGVFGGIYFYQDFRSSTPWGDTRPDYGRTEVRQFIRDNALMWLEDFHLDGLRWDSTLTMRTHSGGDNAEGWGLLQWINNEIDARQPWKINIAEDMQGNAWLTKDTGAGGAGFDSQWTAQFIHPVRAVLQEQDDNNRDMNALKDAIAYQFSGDAFERVMYTESHDEVANGRSRVPEDIWPGNAGSWFSRKRSTLGAALVMTTPGIPMIFQGQEILEDGFFADTDPVDWSKLTTYSGIHQLYRDLIRMRRNWQDNTRGLRGHHMNVFHVNNASKVIGYHRWDQGGPADDVIVVANFRNTTWTNYRIGLPRAGVWRVRFNSDWSGYSGDYGNHFTPDLMSEPIAYDGMPQSATLSIAPYTALILSQD